MCHVITRSWNRKAYERLLLRCQYIHATHGIQQKGLQMQAEVKHLYLMLCNPNITTKSFDRGKNSIYLNTPWATVSIAINVRIENGHMVVDKLRLGS